ncbi:RNA methyltransferase [Simiduia curdlanivorans]|uniref:RNA methyltransferase n=1 Tax=Simiduia curdlanivorans TaxID=1492769 RepID=A0ABV8V0N3_9GAMM|nr:RNA methyltransferase [Simiduia curdlanivorans]MDN3637692.1 RNA methyltransferase [Simiduia curdlanivorans]
MNDKTSCDQGASSAPIAINAPTVAIGLTNPKSPSNVGAVMRAAGCYQADAVFYSGNRYAKAAKFHTDTQRAGENIPLEHIDDFFAAIPSTMAVVCVDLVEGAVPLPAFQHPAQALYLFGPEDGTLKQAIIDRAHAVVYVPTVGSMNLAASVNVVLYDRLAKSGPSLLDNGLIRASRDVNNRVRVKKANKV